MPLYVPEVTYLWVRLVPAADASGCRASLLDVQVRVQYAKSVARYYPDVVVSGDEIR